MSSRGPLPTVIAMTHTTLAGSSPSTQSLSSRHSEESAAPSHDAFMAPRPADPATVEEFVGRVMTDFAAAASTAMTVIGDRLGLYEAMAGAGRLTAHDLATRTRLNQRLVTEWLATQTVARYVTYDSSTHTYDSAAAPSEPATAVVVQSTPCGSNLLANTRNGQCQRYQL